MSGDLVEVVISGSKEKEANFKSAKIENISISIVSLRDGGSALKIRGAIEKELIILRCKGDNFGKNNKQSAIHMTYLEKGIYGFPVPEEFIKSLKEGKEPFSKELSNTIAENIEYVKIISDKLIQINNWPGELGVRILKKYPKNFRKSITITLTKLIAPKINVAICFAIVSFLLGLALMSWGFLEEKEIISFQIISGFFALVTSIGILFFIRSQKKIQIEVKKIYHPLDDVKF